LTYAAQSSSTPLQDVGQYKSENGHTFNIRVSEGQGDVAIFHTHDRCNKCGNCDIFKYHKIDDIIDALVFARNMARPNRIRSEDDFPTIDEAIPSTFRDASLKNVEYTAWESMRRLPEKQQRIIMAFLRRTWSNRRRSKRKDNKQ
jgi:hypothetical protein